MAIQFLTPGTILFAGAGSIAMAAACCCEECDPCCALDSSVPLFASYTGTGCWCEGPPFDEVLDGTSDLAWEAADPGGADPLCTSEVYNGTWGPIARCMKNRMFLQCIDGVYYLTTNICAAEDETFPMTTVSCDPLHLTCTVEIPSACCDAGNSYTFDITE